MSPSQVTCITFIISRTRSDCRQPVCHFLLILLVHSSIFTLKKHFYYYYNNNAVFNPTCSCPGRLLRANQISFNWDRLASWINLTEQWPYRTSWLILYLEETDGVPDHATLKTIYERSEVTLPPQV